MKAKTARRALLTSALALLLCVSMLIGTTFAWFTDSVTSSGNKIQAGKLDIELYMWTSATDSVEITNESAPIFQIADKAQAGTKTLWEPGKTEVVYFSIKNNGSLDLKYQVALDVLDTDGDQDLYEVMKYAIVGDAKYGDITVWDATNARSAQLGINKVQAKNVTLAAGSEHFFALSVHMDETAGNEYQGGQIDFDLKVLATQLASEFDSFDEKYDTDATYPVLSQKVILPETEPSEGYKDVVLGTGDEIKTTAKIPAGLVEDLAENTANPVKSVELQQSEPVYGAGSVTFDYLELVDQNDNPIDLEAMNNNKPIIVTLAVGNAFNVGDTVVIYHDDEPIASAVVNADKEIVYTAYHFCKVKVSTGDGKVDSGAELNAAVAQNGTIKLEENLTITEPIVIPEGVEVTLDLNGKTITGTKGRDADNNRIHVIVNNGNLTIKDGTVKSAGNDGGSAIYNAEGATLTLENVTALGAPQSDPVYEAGVSKPYPSYAINNYGNAVVNGATVKSYHGAIATGGNGVTVINDADIDVGLDQSTGITSYAIYSYENAQVTVNGGKFAFTKKEVYVNGGNMFCELGSNAIVVNGGNFTGGGFSVGDGREYVIKGGTFGFDPSKYVADGYVAIKNTDTNTWSIYGASDKVTMKDGAVLDLNGVEFGGTIVAEGDLTIKGDTKIKTLTATNGGTITIEDGKTLTLNNFSFGAKGNASAEYTITGGKVVASYGFFQHGKYELHSDFETGYMYYSYGSDITVYGTFHSQGKGDGLDYVRGKLTIANGGKTIHDNSLWVGQPASWGAMNATLIVEDGGYVQANNLNVYSGSSLQIDAKNAVAGEVSNIVCRKITNEGNVEAINNDTLTAEVLGNKINLK